MKEYKAELEGGHATFPFDTWIGFGFGGGVLLAWLLWNWDVLLPKYGGYFFAGSLALSFCVSAASFLSLLRQRLLNKNYTLVYLHDSAEKTGFIEKHKDQLLYGLITTFGAVLTAVLTVWLTGG